MKDNTIPKDFYELFDVFSKNEIRFCSWKNNHQLGEAFHGKSDLDLLADIQKKHLFQSILKKHNWFKLYNPSINLNPIDHYYKYSHGIFFHIHIYSKLWTGNSWLKEYDLPFVDDILSCIIKDPIYGIPIPCKKHANAIFVFREKVKNSNLIGRYLYYKDQESYKKELIYISNMSEFHNGHQNLNNLEVLKNKNLRAHNIYKRYGLIRSSINLLSQFILRIFFKLLKIKKLIPNRGRIIVITGPDGSGKSSLVKNLYLNHSLIQKTYYINLGRPYGTIINKIISSKNNSSNNIKKMTGLFHEAKAVLIALMRAYNALKCNFFMSNGFLVLCDRWPSKKYGTIDGPRINPESNILWGSFRIIELHLYNLIPLADLSINLQVDIETALQRNINRLKDNKETDDEIIMRYNQSAKLQPFTKKTIPFINDVSEAEAISAIELIIQKELQ